VNIAENPIEFYFYVLLFLIIVTIVCAKLNKIAGKISGSILYLAIAFPIFLIIGGIISFLNTPHPHARYPGVDYSTPFFTPLIVIILAVIILVGLFVIWRPRSCFTNIND